MNVLGIFVKQPVPGRVKTRLAADVGNDCAAALYAAFTEDVVDRFRDAADRRLLCHTPNDEPARSHFHDLSRQDYELWPQPEGPLGVRLDRFFSDAFDAGADRVVAIGSDSPTLPLFLVTEAFKRLADHECVIGPATDGGYYLIGQRERHRPLFDHIDWSEPTVLRQTIARIESASARPALLMPWYDVDTLDNLELLRGHICAMHATGESMSVPRTELCLERLSDH
jgi:rSAM/selenodomain-associated transferase 1